MGPQADDLDRFFFFQHLVHQPVLAVDPPGIQSVQVANQFSKLGGV